MVLVRPSRERSSWLRAAILLVVFLTRVGLLLAARSGALGAQLVIYVNGPAGGDRFGPDNLYERRAALALREDLRRQRHLWKLSPEPIVYDWTDFGERAYGAWAVWPILTQLEKKLDDAKIDKNWWLVIVEPDSALRLDVLYDTLSADYMKPDRPLFFGHVLRDADTTVIHHYAPGVNDWKYRNGVQDDDTMEDKVLAYPESAAGLALSGALVHRGFGHIFSLVEYLTDAGTAGREFTIDWRYELAQLVQSASGVRLQNAPWLCMRLPTAGAGDEGAHGAAADGADEPQEPAGNDDDGRYCAVVFAGRQPDRFCATPERGEPAVDEERVAFAVKTFQGYHKDRVVVVKRTWAPDAKIIEFFSDVEDLLIPSIVVDTPNTESGHCAKTLEIMRRFLAQDPWFHVRWLVILDDDSLISVPRLMDLVKCYDDTKPLIIGERYGFGFSADGSGGYDYPTGGSGMIFSKPAVRLLVDACSCPAINSPDDMIVGSCARHVGVPLVHSAALHQARPIDYTPTYLSRQPPISFHKHWEVDPYQVYDTWLRPRPDEVDGDEGRRQDESADTGRRGDSNSGTKTEL